MKLPITIKYHSGEEATYTANPPEWAKWEKQTGNIIGQAQEKMGIWDLMFLAYHAHKRELGGKPVKNFDNWMDSVADVIVGDGGDPKVTSPEV